MISIIYQPVVNVWTEEVVMVEILCRPTNQPVSEYFSVKDPIELWRREAACIKEGMKLNSNVPKAMNITISSLPFFLQTDWKWEGILEIVEWGPRQKELNSALPFLVSQLHQRGLKVWVDDLVPKEWPRWGNLAVDGFKINVKEIDEHPSFIRQLKQQGKPIVVECVEDIQSRDKVRQHGFTLAQGFFYSLVSL